MAAIDNVDFYSDFYLDSLAERVKQAYTRNRKNGVIDSSMKDIDVTSTPNSVHNPFYRYFKNDIEASTHDEISVGLIFKLLGRQHHKKEFVTVEQKLGYKRKSNSFKKTSIEIFEKYSRIIRTPLENISIGIVSSLEGALLIDWSFYKNFEKDVDRYSKTDFFLLSDDEDLQWYGLVRNWDYTREETKSFLEKMTDSFNWSSKVAGVVFGDAGCGKSLFLRRLAFICLRKGFIIFWVNDFKTFLKNKLTSLEPNHRYLIFIDNWGIAEEQNSLFNKFLNNIGNTNNIKLVIGDREPNGRSYKRSVFDNNLLEIKADKNAPVVKKIVSNSVWEDTAKRIWSTALLDAPLFIIVFVIARETKETENRAIKDVFSRFKEIVNDDMEKLYNLQPGVALALYYYAFLSGKFLIFFPWSTFCRLADGLNNSVNVSNALIHFSPLNPVVKVLKNYIYHVELLDPRIENDHLFFFHHMLLVESLNEPEAGVYYVDNDIIQKIVRILAKGNEGDVQVAIFLIDRLRKSGLFTSDVESQIDHILENVRMRHLSFKFSLDAHFRLQSAYRSATSPDKDQWEFYVVIFGIIFQHYMEHYNRIFYNLIEKGCTDRLVKWAFELTATETGCNEFRNYCRDQLKTWDESKLLPYN